MKQISKLTSHKLYTLFYLLFLAAIITPDAGAYELEGYSWPTPTAAFYVDIPGADGLWNDAFETAMYQWSEGTVFQYYIIRDTYSDPCQEDDEKNGVKFAASNCDDAWGQRTLAVTHIWYTGNTITETDIVFNANQNWDVYSGPWSYSANDFRRVAIHELGHALGLGHEDSGVDAIMASYAGDIYFTQEDDIEGVAAIYGEPNLTYYRDRDADGYGNTNSPYTAATQPYGYVANDWDCNDYDVTIHPGAVEILDDGTDQDCDGADITNSKRIQVAKLYVATFNRAPDAEGLDYWTSSENFTIEMIAKTFFDQEETQKLYPEDTSNESFVIAIYKNLFNRLPETEGYQYWVDVLDNNLVSRFSAILAFINGAQGTDTAILGNKAEVGLYHANLGLNTNNFYLYDITEDTATVKVEKQGVYDLYRHTID